VVDKTYDHGVKPVLDVYDRVNGSPKSSPISKTGQAPPIPHKPANLQTKFADDSRASAPYSATGDGYTSSPLADSKGLPSYDESISAASAPRRTSASAPATPASAKAKRPWLNRIVLAGEVVLTSLESTAHELINTGTAAASSAAG
jgi:spartin